MAAKTCPQCEYPIKRKPVMDGKAKLCSPQCRDLWRVRADPEHCWCPACRVVE